MQLKVAILDMYKGAPNQGMRNIHEILNRYSSENQIELERAVFDVRGKGEIPSLEFHAFISSGGPGNPIEQEGWEAEWKKWMSDVMAFNQEERVYKRYVFLICHSFQLMCHHFQLAHVSKRRTESFGVFPIHPTSAGKKNRFTGQLPDPFWGVDSRFYQVVKPDAYAMNRMGAQILAIEKDRPNVPLERATMAIQFTPQIVGTQFHPEADADGFLYFLQDEDKKKVIIENHGLRKYNNMIGHLKDPDKIHLTQRKMIPVFLDEVVHSHYNHFASA